MPNPNIFKLSFRQEDFRASARDGDTVHKVHAHLGLTAVIIWSRSDARPALERLSFLCGELKVF